MHRYQGKPFQDLTITGINRELCRFVDSGTFRLHLQLSDYPPAGWSYAFGKIWEGTEYARKPRAGTDDATLWIDCAPAELRPHHLKELEGAIARTNRHFRESQQQLAKQLQQQTAQNSTLYAQLDALEESFRSPAPVRTGWWQTLARLWRKPAPDRA